MTINNLLFSVQNMAPALLSLGTNKAQNYSNLADLMGLNEDSSTTASSQKTDSVSLTYKSIGSKMVSDLASLTASTIKEYPELDKDYVIAIVDDGTSRQARVYRRSDILDNFQGTDEEKEELAKQLEANPLMVFNNASGLPETAPDQASQALAAKINDFLKTNAKTFDVLDKAGYDPLADFLGDSVQKKILAFYAHALLEDEEEEEAPAAPEKAAEDDSGDSSDEETPPEE